MARHHAEKHGHKPRSGASPTYTSWNMMMARCYRPSSPSFKNYGARGITVCPRWHEFAEFLEDMGERPAGKSLDRVDPSKNYDPGNCRWATRVEQNRNRRTSRLITFNGETLTLAAWAERIGVHRRTLGMRINTYHWPLSRALKEKANVRP